MDPGDGSELLSCFFLNFILPARCIGSLIYRMSPVVHQMRAFQLTSQEAWPKAQRQKCEPWSALVKVSLDRDFCSSHLMCHWDQGRGFAPLMTVSKSIYGKMGFPKVPLNSIGRNVFEDSSF